MWMGGGRAGFIGSKFNGDLVPIPIQCAPWSKQGFPLMMGKRFGDPFHDSGSWKGKIEGTKGVGIRESSWMQNRDWYRSMLSPPQEDLYRFLSRDILTFPDEITPPSRAAHSLIHSAIIIGLPQPLRQAKATRVLLIS